MRLLLSMYQIFSADSKVNKRKILNVVKNRKVSLNLILTIYLKSGLDCAIFSTFTPKFMYWKYFDECFMEYSKPFLLDKTMARRKITLMDRNLFFITKNDN